MQMKPIRDQSVYDNTLYCKLCILLPVICIAITSIASLLAGWSLTLVHAAVTYFLSAHVPRSPLELFYDVWNKLFLCLNDVFQSMKLKFSHSCIHAKILYWLYSCTVMWLMKQQFGNPSTHNFTEDRKYLADP